MGRRPKPGGLSRAHTGRNIQKNQAYRTEYRTWRALAINVLGGKCSRCGFSDVRALHFDHIKGNGASCRREGENWLDIVKSVLAGSKDFQLLCANCNEIKKHEELDFSDVSRDVEELRKALTSLMNSSENST